MPYFIYIIECHNGSYYTGYTTDIERRYQEHCQGSSKCKYTRSFPPRSLAGVWFFAEASLGEILALEAKLKKLTKPKKQALVACPSRLKLYTELRFESKT